MKTRNNRNQRTNGKNRKQAKALPELLILPFTIRQQVRDFHISTFEHGNGIEVKGLPELQPTLLDVVQHLPKYLRWMKEKKYRSVSVAIILHKDGKEVDCIAIADFDHPDGKVQSNDSGYIATAKKLRLKPDANN